MIGDYGFNQMELHSIEARINPCQYYLQEKYYRNLILLKKDILKKIFSLRESF